MIIDRILVDKNKCYDHNISDEGFVVYCIIRSSISAKNNIYHRSVAYIGYELYGRVIEKDEELLIQKGLNEIIDKNIINIVSQLNKKEFIIDTTNINKASKMFINIQFSDVRKIMNINTKVNKFALLRYYFIIISTFKFDKSGLSNKIGYMTQSYLRDVADISIPTMNKYNNILVKNKVLFIAKSSENEEYYDENGNHRIIKFRNVYSRYEDKELAIKYANTYSAVNFNSKIHNQVNESRKYVQMYNAMLKGKIYDHDTVVDIYQAIKTWNEDKKDKYEQQITEGYEPEEPKYKDLSIFDKYDLTV